MILEHANWYLGYGQILEDCRRLRGKCLILCHADVDAMAAARIWTYMLRADHVEYVLMPCATSSALEKYAVGTPNHYAAIVLLNVGGTRNLTRLFGDQKLSLDATKIYVLDQRRPVHLANVHAENHVVVFWDPSHGDIEDLPSDGDNLSGNDDSSESESDSESEEEDAEDEGEAEFEDNDDEDEAEFQEGDVEGETRNPKSVVAADQATEDMEVDYDGEDEKDLAEDDDDDRITPKKKKQKKTRSNETDTGNETDSTQGLDDDDDPATPPTALTGTTAPSTTQGTTLPALTPAQKHEQRQYRLRYYYSHGSSYGSPTSYVAYNVASQLRFSSIPDLLWLCMVGVTDSYLQARLDVLGYAKMADMLRESCLKIFPTPNALERAENTVYAEALLVGSSTDHQTKLTFSERGRIISDTDFKFFLLRHGSLLDALQCSPYVSTQMQLWTTQGMQKLLEMLARMGYPLNECKQPFNYMKPSLRRQLKAQLSLYKEEYNLAELEFTSFVRVTGFSSLTSASDVCYAASALLECPMISHTTKTEKAKDTDWDLDCFHAAYDILGTNTAATTSLANNKHKAAATLQTGIQWATKLQRLILQTAVRLVNQNAITRLHHFRYAYITTTSAHPGEASQINFAGSNKNNSKPEVHVLAKPLALTRLAHYLMDMHRANGKWVGPKKQLPLILLAEQPANGTYLVAGYEMAEHAGYQSPNKLGQHFALVAHSMKTPGEGDAVARLESFDAHVVEVASTHAQRFLEQLHYILDSA